VENAPDPLKTGSIALLEVLEGLPDATVGATRDYVRSVLGNPRGILGIDFPIAAPINRIEVAQRLQVVEQRPDDAVGEAEVKVVHLLCIQADRRQRIARRSARSLGCQLDLLVGFGRAGPADPHTTAVAQHRKQCRHQPT